MHRMHQFDFSEMVNEILLDFHRNPQMYMDVPRRKTTFIIREDLLEKAEELGLLGRNLSVFVERFLEKFLEEYKRFLEGQFQHPTPGVGFEPTRPYGQGISSPVLYFDRDKEEWYEWAKRETPSSANKYKSKLEIYLRGLKIYTPEDLRKAIQGIDPNDRHAFLAIRNYIRFLKQTGKIRRSEAEDFRAVVPNIKTRARSEAEKAVSAEDIIRAYRSIKGERMVKKARQLFFKLLLFTGLRELEVFSLVNQFDSKVVDKTIKAFSLEKYADKLAVYDLETIEIPTRKHATKRGYIAIFPAELVDEILEVKSAIVLKYSIIRKDRMFESPDEVIDLALLRKFHYNFFNDNALKVPDMPSDVYRIIDFIQGRTHKEVGGRSYRANVQTAVRLYYALVDEYKRVFDILF